MEQTCTLCCALGICLLRLWLLGSHCVLHDGHMGDTPFPSHLVFCHNPSQLHFFTAEKRRDLLTGVKVKLSVFSVYSDTHILQDLKCDVSDYLNWHVSDIFRCREGLSRPVQEAVKEDQAGQTRPDPHDNPKRHTKVINQLGLRGQKQE